MRNHIPKLKTLKYTKTREEQINSDYGKIILIESDNPNFSHEVYDFNTGVFRGYTGNKKFKEKREISIAKGDLIDKSDQSRFSQFNLENIE